MVVFEKFQKELIEVLMHKATILEKQDKLDAFSFKYKGLFEFVGVSEATVGMKPRQITIGCKHNSQITAFYSLGVFIKKFPESAIMDYNRIITINNIINE